MLQKYIVDPSLNLGWDDHNKELDVGYNCVMEHMKSLFLKMVELINVKSIADMDDKELMEYFRELEKKGEGKPLSIEQVKEEYYKCQRLAVQTWRIAKQTAKQRDSLFELLQSAREEIKELKKKK